MIIKDINNLSITELKQLLAQVNHDLKMNKPTIKRGARIKPEKPALSELAECNIIASRFTGNKALPPSDNDKLRADIQIQKDILEFINNGGDIKTTKRRKQIKPLSTTFGAFTMNYSL